jgi:hypothetical protein
VAPSPLKAAAFQQALSRVNEDPKARAALLRGYNAATGSCVGGLCPAKIYSITVERKEGPVASDQQYRWDVTGSAQPTASEWKAFEALYAPRPAFCPVLASIVLHTRASGVAQISGLFDQKSRQEAARLVGGCPCNYNGEPGKKGSPCTTCGGYFGRSCDTELEYRRGDADGQQSKSEPDTTAVR